MKEAIAQLLKQSVGNVSMNIQRVTNGVVVTINGPQSDNMMATQTQFVVEGADEKTVAEIKAQIEGVL